MTEIAIPFDAGPGSSVAEGGWQKMARHWLATGPISGHLNELAVSAAGSGMSVSVASGGAWIRGFYYETDAPVSVTIAAAHATLPRIDRVVARLDRSANTITLEAITGTAAAVPAAPALSTTDDLYELLLADVAVPAAAGVISGGNVTDRRVLTGDARLVLKSQFDAKGDLLVGTADDTFTRKAVGANDTVLTADSAAAGGVKWAAPGGLLGYCQYDPATTVLKLISTLSFTALDTTNLRVTFTAPASGVVEIHFGAWGSNNGVNSNGPNIGVLQGSTVIALSGYQGMSVAGSQFGPIAVTRRIAGLTPGASYTWDLAAASSQSGPNVAVQYGGGNDGTACGPAFLFVRAA